MSHHAKGKQYAKKPAEKVASSYLHGRCLPTDKKNWIKQSKKEGYSSLMKWVIETLNNRSQNNNISNIKKGKKNEN